jgi:phosphate-selective porin OprO/OprP
VPAGITTLFALSAHQLYLSANFNYTNQYTMRSFSTLILFLTIFFSVQGIAQSADTTANSDKKILKPDKVAVVAGVPLTIAGYAQIRFLSQQEAGKPDGFDIRRARLDLKAQLNPKWDFRLQLEFATSPKILDAITSYKYRDWLKVTAGQFKVPLSLENNTASNKLLTIDRSQVVEALVARSKDVIGNHNGRDIGMQVSGSAWKKGDRFIFDYYAGVFNGSGINISDNNEAKDISARLVFHPLKDLDVGGAYYNGWARFGNPAADKARTRFAAELAYSWKFLAVQGEYLQGADGAIIKEGWYGQLAAFVYKKNIQLVAKYDTYDPNIASDKTNDSSTNYVFGANFYVNSFVKIQINYTNRVEEGTAINNDLIAVQFQAGF